MSLTESYAQIQNYGHKITKPQSTIFSNVPHHKNRQNGRIQLKSNFIKSISKSISFQNSTFFLRVIFEHSMPLFEAAHQVFEVGKGDSAEARTVKGHYDLSADFQACTALDVI